MPFLWASFVACEREVVLRPSTTRSPDPRWEPLAPVPEARQECGVAAFDGGVALVGGYGADGVFVDDVFWYDPGVDAWSALPDLPRAVHHANVAVLDDGLHVAGSLIEGFRELRDHWLLAPGADQWVSLAPLPAVTAVGASGVAVVAGQLHLVGGQHQTRSVAFHQVWDPATDTWDVLVSAPTARDHFTLAAAGEGLVAVAGRADGLEAFTPETDRWDGAQWTAGEPLPTPRGGGMAALDDDGLLHVVGGEGNVNVPDGVFGAHEVYDPVSDTWTVLDPMVAPRHGTGAAWLDGAMYVPGGASVLRLGAVDTHDRWVP
jgi:N-acetylneuraminic acid mutarotase